MQLEFHSIIVTRNYEHCSKEICFSQEAFAFTKSSKIASAFVITSTECLRLHPHISYLHYTADQTVHCTDR